MENNYYKVINITLLASQDISEAKIKKCLERDFLIEAEGKTNTGITQWQIETKSSSGPAIVKYDRNNQTPTL